MKYADLSAFLEAETVADRSGRIRSSELYSRALAWLARHNKQTCSHKAFSTAMADAGFTKKTSDGVWFLGAKLKMSEEKPPAPAASSDAARQARRLLRLALEDYYDDRARCYRDGRTDASLAKEFGLSESAVAKIREEDYGPLERPTDLAGLIADVREAKRQIAALEGRLQLICRTHGWPS
jgi:hypothetical protein